MRNSTLRLGQHVNGKSRAHFSAPGAVVFEATPRPVKRWFTPSGGRESFVTIFQAGESVHYYMDM
ncbi:hypothetical protein B0G57_10293 [Trinickia symbiotica]|uniref:Uncharacterized protein n=2 Tax=Trinickia symbiotica TaxID=863227 RepID=A0A2N7X9V6_9BURK|nr:hypothetical protein C0Z20_01150 [Trinickia symbiotica]PPK46498.1 hypothetical protein B0G57_10293 [Trinickia symbiotica]